jgi:hypothetical protein
VLAEVGSGVACLERVVGAILVCIVVIFVDSPCIPGQVVDILLRNSR